MGNVVNLNKARKRRARQQAEQQAAANRVRFGRTMEQKQRDAAAEAEAQRKLDQLKLDGKKGSDDFPPEDPA
jgi:hypothetical protein